MKALFLLLLMLYMGEMPVFAEGLEQSFILSLTTGNSEEEYEQVPMYPGRHRSSSPLIACYITPSDIIVTGYETHVIKSFEILDDEGFCMGFFSEKRDFLATLFTLSGHYEIRLHIDDILLHGFIEI